jgi:hypothetical protein
MAFGHMALDFMAFGLKALGHWHLAVIHFDLVTFGRMQFIKTALG